MCKSSQGRWCGNFLLNVDDGSISDAKQVELHMSYRATHSKSATVRFLRAYSCTIVPNQITSVDVISTVAETDRANMPHAFHGKKKAHVLCQAAASLSGFCEAWAPSGTMSITFRMSNMVPDSISQFQSWISTIKESTAHVRNLTSVIVNRPSNNLSLGFPCFSAEHHPFTPDVGSCVSRPVGAKEASSKGEQTVGAQSVGGEGGWLRFGIWL